MSRTLWTSMTGQLGLCASLLACVGCSRRDAAEQQKVQAAAVEEQESALASAPGAAQANAAQAKHSADPNKDAAANGDAAEVPWANRLTRDSGFPCEVEQVLSQSCRRCHWEPRENDAPFGMVRYEDVQKVRSGKPIFKLMEQMIEADLMPPLDALVTPAVTPLEPEQKQRLLSWLKQGAPRSGDACSF